MNGMDYAPGLCDRMGLDPDPYEPVLARILEGQADAEIAEALGLSQVKMRSCRRRIRAMCASVLGDSTTVRTPIQVEILRMVVLGLEAELEASRTKMSRPALWSGALPGERECALLGETVAPFVQDVVRLMQGIRFEATEGFERVVFEAAVPYLKRYLTRIQRPIDLRACILAVRAAHFEDECGRLQARKLEP